MYRRYKKSIHSKILSLVLVVIAMMIAASYLWQYSNEKTQLIEEKLRASEMVAQVILNDVATDMLEGRADMIRHFMEDMSAAEHVDRLAIIRGNGVEEAFKDMKTIREVEGRLGGVRQEWLKGHAEVENNVAEGVDDPGFKKAFEAFKKDWRSEPVHYVEEDGRYLTYLRPIEEQEACGMCHVPEGARGVLMISTSLDGMYAALKDARDRLLLSGVLTLLIVGTLLSLLIRAFVTGPIGRAVGVIESVTEKIAAGKANISARVDVSSQDEVGYLANAFNEMIESLNTRVREKRLLLEKVSKSRQEWETTFDSINDLITIHDRDHNLMKVNKAFAEKVGREPKELIGEKCYTYFHCTEEPIDDCPHDKTLESKCMESLELREPHLKGDYHITTYPILNEVGEVTATVHIARDITEEKALKERLIHTEKLSGIGKFVAGIAHELNNPLMGIMGYSQLLMESPGDRKVEDIKDKLGKIYKESMRTAKIVQNLLTFARARKPERARHNLNDMVRETLELRESSFRYNNIEVVTELSPDVPDTMVDYYQLQQVLINVVNNAADAMVAHRGEGKLEIKTTLKGRIIEISVIDNGPGIPAKFLNRVFEPFFTTKETGKGTGLGLSISHGILKEHGGWIDISSREGEGTTVTLELPVIAREDEEAEGEASGEERKEAAAGARVLVVDDEPGIREPLSDILSGEGFFVEVSSDGKEALDIMEGKEFDIVITDMKMQGMGGKEFYTAAVKRDGRMKDRFIVLTGDIFSQDVKDFLDKSGCPYLLKPFEAKNLLRMVNDRLSSVS
ncbi:MAG: ATP-binding protein [Thermodesulfobacteriota bacterium]